MLQVKPTMRSPDLTDESHHDRRRKRCQYRGSTKHSRVELDVCAGEAQGCGVEFKKNVVHVEVRVVVSNTCHAMKQVPSVHLACASRTRKVDLVQNILGDPPAGPKALGSERWRKNCSSCTVNEANSHRASTDSEDTNQESVDRRIATDSEANMAGPRDAANCKCIRVRQYRGLQMGTHQTVHQRVPHVLVARTRLDSDSESQSETWTSNTRLRPKT